ncbi:MAG: MGMT family protein [bacterium]|nr:MGMT family protein [bacterium]
MRSFKDRVYEAVKTIPKGKVFTYRDVAFLAGSLGAYRAVGTALSKNRDPEVPCHRVIRSDGKIGGYNQGSKKKESLLKKEGVSISSLPSLRSLQI